MTATPQQLSIRPTVLVVDDDPEIARAVQLRLHQAGFGAILAHDGAEALAIAASRRPDAVVLDLRMPAMDGFAVLARLVESEGVTAIPAIILSADVAERARLKALNDGAAYFVEKPYRPHDLIAALNAALQSWRVRNHSIPLNGEAYDGAAGPG
jgi:two-component system KDP operon response regulator KdpE